MPRINLEVICHKLAIYPKVKTNRQKKHKLKVKRQKAAAAKTEKLLRAGFIREIHFTSWLVNVVMTLKSLVKWRMCADFTDLNKA